MDPVIVHVFYWQIQHQAAHNECPLSFGSKHSMSIFGDWHYHTHSHSHVNFIVWGFYTILSIDGNFVETSSPKCEFPSNIFIDPTTTHRHQLQKTFSLWIFYFLFSSVHSIGQLILFQSISLIGWLHLVALFYNMIIDIKHTFHSIRFVRKQVWTGGK